MKYENGDEVVIDGIRFVVVNYIDSKNVYIKNLETGEELRSRNEVLQGKRGRKIQYKPKQKHMPSPKLGDRFLTNHYGWITVVKLSGYYIDVQFDNTGFIKENVYRAKVHTGGIKDDSIGRLSSKAFKQLFVKGSIFTTKNFGDIEVVEVKDSKAITIKWLDTGRIQKSITSTEIRSGNLCDYQRKTEWDFLGVGDKHYVYGVKHKGEIVYVGKGVGRRYLHTCNGRSHNKELNRIYFCEGEKVEVFIILSGITDSKQAQRLEKEFILELNPKYNSVVLNSEYD